MYIKMVEKVKKDISIIKYSAATVNLQTSTANHPYLSHIIHLINEVWELKFYSLDTVSCCRPHWY